MYDAFKDNHDKPLTIRSLYYYAKEDNKDEFINIIRTQSRFTGFELTYRYCALH